MAQAQKGSWVLYTVKIDTDPTETPNIWPAVITKINETGADLQVLHSVGGFQMQDVKEGQPGERGTWHWPVITTETV